MLAGPGMVYLLLRFLLSPVQIRVLTGLLDKADYGIISLIASTVTFIAILASFGHFEFMVRRLPGLPAPLQYGVLHHLNRLFLPLVLLIACALFFFLEYVPGMQEHGGRLAVAPRLLTSVAFVLIAMLLQRIFFLVSRAEWFKVRTLQLLQSDTWFIPFAVAYACGVRGLAAALCVWVGWLAATTLLARIWTFSREREPSIPEDLCLRTALCFGLPLLPWLLGELLLRLGDRYVLLAVCGPEIVANYTLCANIGILVYVIAVILIDPFVPELNRVYNQADLAGADETPALATIFSTMLRLALAVGLAGAVFILLANQQLLRLLSGTGFLDAAGLLLWFAPVPVLTILWNCCSRLLLLKNQTVSMGLITLAACALNIATNLYLVPRLGAMGAAGVYIATLSGLFIVTAVRAKAWQRIDLRALRPFRLLLWTAVCAAILLLLRTICPTLPPLAWLAGAAALCTPFAFLIGVVRPSDFSFGTTAA